MGRLAGLFLLLAGLLVLPAPAAAQQPEDADSKPYPSGLSFQVSGWFDGLRIPGSDERFGSSEVASLEGQRLGTGQWDAEVAGVVQGVAAIPHEWLRLPEFRVYLGGGEVNGPSAQVNNDFYVRPSSVFVVRFEIGAGVQHALGPIAPYVIARLAGGVNVFSVNVYHPELGSLGNETVALLAGELGVEAGVQIQLGGPIRMHVAFRHTLLGAEGSGFLFGYGLNFDD